jgi:hypothetical protein
MQIASALRGRRESLIVLVGLILAAECFARATQATPPPEITTPKDRKELSITVYREGAAVVRDTRQVELPEGAVDLQFSSVARQLLPDSVQVEPITAPDGLAVYGQTYGYDLLNPERLLQAYVGQPLTLVLRRKKEGSDVEQHVEATLLAANPEPVWRIGGKIETGLRVDHYIFPAIPPGLTASPSLVLSLENHHAGQQSIRVSYLANSLSWDPNYFIQVKPDWKTADLSARAAISNQTGADYDQAELQLVAGDVRRVEEGAGYGAGSGGGMGGSVFAAGANRVLISAPSPPQQVPFYGYHLYTFPHPVDLQNDSTNQVSLFASSGLRISRSYVVTGQAYYNQGVEPSELLNTPVELYLKFDNTKANLLGEPLPEGVVRVYKPDQAGHAQLIGEDRLGDTAPGETVRLDLGNAFDVVEKGKQTDYKRTGPNAAEAAYEITIRNHQSQPVVVIVNEPFHGDWQILSSSVPYKKTSSTSARFHVPVPANGSTVLTYRVRIRWGA